MTDYLQKILTARVYDVARETPLDKAANLSARLNNTLLLKREDMQSVFSFKLRGAYNKMAHLAPEVLKRGVICASAGNHAQGVALAAHKLGIRAVIVMPTTTPQIKIDAVKKLGGEVVLAGFYSAPLSFSFPPAFMREARIRVAAEWREGDLVAVKALVACGALSLDGLITHRQPANAASDAYRTAFEDPSCLKMVLDWRSLS